MRKDYKSVNDIQLGEKKKYLLKICSDYRCQELVYECMTKQQFQQMMNHEKIRKQLYTSALKALYRSSNYETLEYHLVMMNALFNEESYIEIKKQLLQKICKKTITIHEYCVLRQLIDFQNIPFENIIEKLHGTYEVEAQECARICLLEDQYHLAYHYLKQLEDCHDDHLLDLLCSYSAYDYVSLMRHYAKKKRGYQLVPTH